VLDSGWRVSTSCDVAAERRCCRVVTGSVHVIRNVAGYGYWNSWGDTWSKAASPLHFWLFCVMLFITCQYTIA